MNHPLLTGLLAASAFSMFAAASAQESQSRAESHQVAGFSQGRYFLVTPREQPVEQTDTAKAPPLLVVLPGGDGGPEFLTFVQNTILDNPTAAKMVGAMVTAPRWSENQDTPWPTQDLPVDGMRYTTEALVSAVIDDVRQRVRIDTSRIYLFAWGSSGHAAVRLMTGLRTDFAGVYLAMSSYHGLPRRLAQCKDRRFVIDHSSGDRVHPLADALAAAERLNKEGATVWARQTRGSHGWTESARSGIESGLAWLTSTLPVPAAVVMIEPVRGRQLLANGGFEGGLGGWDTIDNSGTLEVTVDEEIAQEGMRCLHIKKTGKITSDSLRQQIPLSGQRNVQVAMRMRSASANEFRANLLMHAPDGQVLAEDTEVAEIADDQDWHWLIREFRVPVGAKFATLLFTFELDGEIWLDDVRVIEPALPNGEPTVPAPGK